jgi:hypothetical protein
MPFRLSPRLGGNSAVASEYGVGASLVVPGPTMHQVIPDDAGLFVLKTFDRNMFVRLSPRLGGNSDVASEYGVGVSLVVPGPIMYEPYRGALSKRCP